jgi:CBS-domain-containing membrane protein
MSYWLVKSVMTPDVVTVSPRSTYREIVDALVNAKVSGAPVVDATGRVVGVVTEADLLHRIDAVAADLMSAPPIMVRPDVSVAAAARVMEGKRVKRLPVVDEHGRLLGIVSRRDLLRMHVRPDNAIRADVYDDVLRRTLWLDPATVRVTVREGVVRLTGTTERRSTAGLLVRLTCDVAGVVDVVDEIDWEYDDSELVGWRGYAYGGPTDR